MAKIEKEIASTFRFQLQAAGGPEAVELAAQHLEKLGRDKKIVVTRLLELEEAELSQKDSAGHRKVIEMNMKEFKRCFHKASPVTKRRLMRKVLWKLVYQPKGLDAYFSFDEGTRGPAPSTTEGGVMENLVHLKQKKQAGPALSLSFEFLRVEGNGWGLISQWLINGLARFGRRHPGVSLRGAPSAARYAIVAYRFVLNASVGRIHHKVAASLLVLPPARRAGALL